MVWGFALSLAFHLAVALADTGHKVLAVDLDRRQQSLSRALMARGGTAKRLGVRLPLPRHLLLQQHSGAQLCQELARAGWDCDYVVIDAPGHDSPIARRAIAPTFPARDFDGVRITCSFGVTAVRSEDRLEDVQQRVDAALYAAKRGRKNTVVTAVAG